MEIVKVAAQALQVETGREAAIPKAVRVQAVSRDGGVAGEALPRVEALANDQADADQLGQAAQELAGHYNLKMEVAWDDRTGRQVLKVLSPEGDRLLRQFPAEAVLRMAERLRSGADDGLLTSLV